MKAMSIYEAIPAIIGAVSPVLKTRTNAQQGYSFRGVDDVYAVLNLLLAKHGVSIIPTVTDSSHEAFQTKNGAQMFRHLARVRYTLYAEDGSNIVSEVEGEGMDSGDKATQKALSMAYKYMAFQVFCIPTGEKIDTEEDSPEVLPENGNGHSKDPEEGKRAKAAKLTEEFKTELESARKAKDVEAFKGACDKAKGAKDHGWLYAKQIDELRELMAKIQVELMPQPAQAAR